MTSTGDSGPVRPPASHPSSPPGRSPDGGKSTSSNRGALAPAVDRAARILGLLEGAPQRRFSLTQIADALAIPKSTALNICSALVEAQLLRRGQEGYQLGRRLVQLGSAYVSSVDLVREFYEVCRLAPADLNAMIQLSVLDDELNAVFLARQDCNSGLRLGLRAEIGRRVPANCTASGKALLAGLPLVELERRLSHVRGLPTITERSIASPRELRAELDAIRSTGHATENEEVVPGVACIAAAVHTSQREDGLVAVSITSAKENLGGVRTQMMKEVLISLVSLLQARL